MESLIDILTQGRDREAQASKIYGTVIGIVTNNKDPDKLGRVKLRFPWLDDSVESWWARIAQPMGGSGRGFWWIPEIDDEVLVTFEHGDIRFPYVVGTLYNGKDRPPTCDDITGKFGGIEYDHGPYGCGADDHNGDGKNDLRFIRSRSGHLLIFDDHPGAERVTLCDATGGNRIEINMAKNKIVLTSEKGDIELIAAEKIITRCKTWEHHSREDSIMNVDRDLIGTIGRNTTHTSAQNESRTAGANQLRRAGQNIDDVAGTNHRTVAGTNHKVTAAIDSSTTAGKNISIKAGKMFKGAAGMLWSQSAGLAMSLQATMSMTIQSIGMFAISTLGLGTVNAMKNLLIKSGLVKIN